MERRRIIPLLLLAAVLSLPAPSRADNAQNERMRACNADASTKGLTGTERRKFMSTCLRDARGRQQKKMATCNAQSKGMNAEERKAFMSGCLRD